MTRPPDTNRAMYLRCLAGQAPAEELSTAHRELLVRVLHDRGWTDTEIAVHTLMTDYTVGRIRTRTGLAPNKNNNRKRGAA